MPLSQRRKFKVFVLSWPKRMKVHPAICTHCTLTKHLPPCVKKRLTGKGARLTAAQVHNGYFVNNDAGDCREMHRVVARQLLYVLWRSHVQSGIQVVRIVFVPPL